MCGPGIVLGAGDVEINEKEAVSYFKDLLAQKSLHRHRYVYLRGKPLLVPLRESHSCFRNGSSAFRGNKSDQGACVSSLTSIKKSQLQTWQRLRLKRVIKSTFTRAPIHSDAGASSERAAWGMYCIVPPRGLRSSQRPWVFKKMFRSRIFNLRR